MTQTARDGASERHTQIAEAPRVVADAIARFAASLQTLCTAEA